MSWDMGAYPFGNGEPDLSPNTANAMGGRETGCHGAAAVQVGGSHYSNMPMQPWAVLEAVLTPEEFRGFLKGNIVKYAMRSGHKVGSDDAGKAFHYLEKLKEAKP